ncbi:MAG: outer membrane lipoprotein carrier protein LolA [Saprospiraceae bacterium]|nr:outer membrane lipoprotein carrier protein LolA [Lewinella sp.]
MRKLLLLFLGLSLTLITQAQVRENTQYTKAGDSDPAATAILEKLRKKYDAFNSVEADFTLDIQLPEQPKEVQKGTLVRQGDKYKLDLATQSVMSDGKALWLILHNNKEVQINNVPDPEEAEGSLLTPQALFNFYESGKYVYQFVNEFVENGKLVQIIEFKPLDKYSEYSKLRVVVDKKKNEMVSVTAFSKDGSRYIFTIGEFRPNKSYAASFFTFDKSKYPDYYVEDLR